MSSEVVLPEPLHRLFEEGRRLPRPKPTRGYQAGLLVGTMVVLLLPLVYAAFAGLVGWGLYVYAQDYFVRIASLGPAGRFAWVMLLLACVPLVAGFSVLFALLKPVFAPRPRRQQPLTVQARDEPLFVAFVQRISRLLGAPAPREIRLDCRVNASAELRGGALFLNLGLPLVAGLSMRQLAGVTAHEFGHFRQGGAMRLSYLIRRIIHWFVDAVHRRDVWDEWLEEQSESESFGVIFLTLWARGAVGLTRLLLNCLLHLGLAAGGFLLRQMEFDADRAEVAVAGSAGFGASSRRLVELEAGAVRAYREAERLWEGRLQLPSNLPLAIVQQANVLGARERAEIERELADSDTGWFDSHPATGQRISRAEALGEPGLFDADAPAVDLLRNFETLGRFVSLIHYEDDLRLPVRQDVLAPVAGSVRAAPQAIATVPLPAVAPPATLKLNVPVWRGKPEAAAAPEPPPAQPGG
ncbi:MAG: M48 family metalloprotease [Verrucomicrobia bacterium]|nr:M48 family metalloprotease [Verrucomicrobiota bacterium]